MVTWRHTSPLYFQRQSRTTFQKFHLFPGTFQWNARKTRVPLTYHPEFPEFLGKWSAFFICLQRTARAFLGLVVLETGIVNDVIKAVDFAVMTNCDELMSTKIRFSKIGHQSKLMFLIQWTKTIHKNKNLHSIYWKVRQTCSGLFVSKQGNTLKNNISQKKTNCSVVVSLALRIWRLITTSVLVLWYGVYF